jgi:hypothetical protein
MKYLYDLSLKHAFCYRAFGAESLLMCEFDRLQDLHTSTWVAFLAMGRWFAVTLDWTVAGTEGIYYTDKMSRIGTSSPP